MNRIEELFTKFIPIKKKLETKAINELTIQGNISILALLKNPKTNTSLTHQKREKKVTNKQGNNYAYHENNPNLKTKDKNKFLTKKYPEQNFPFNNNSSKIITPMNNVQKNRINSPKNMFNQSTPKYQQNIEYNPHKKNINNGLNNFNTSNNSNSPDKINLLALENDEIKRQDVQKIFEVERTEEEMKKNMADNNNKAQQKNKSYGGDINASDNDMEEDSDFYDDEIENVEKKKKPIKNEVINNNNLSLYKKESLIDLNQNFNIFDKSRLMGGEDDLLNCYNANYDDKNDFYKDNNDSINDNNDNNDYNDNNDKNDNNYMILEQKNNINNTKKNESGKNKNRINEKENNEIKNKNENNENKNENIENNDNENNDISDDNNHEILSLQNNSLKFRIELEEYNDSLYDIKEEKNKNENISLNKCNNIKYETTEGFKDKKKENHINPIKKKNLKSKSCLNTATNNEDIKTYSKKNKKIIQDDEDEDNYDSNIKNNTNELFLSPSITKNEKNIVEKASNRKESLISNEGSKIIFFFDNDSTSKKVPPTKTNMDKNKVNINKNNINDNYDLLCVDSIHNILKQIEEKLKEENSDKKINNRCYEIINKIKSNNTDLIRRKKNTYLGILKILEILFSLLRDNKTCKKYNNEICQILGCIQKYYKNIKKYDSSINNITYYYNKQIAFKYIYSSLELKNYDNNTLKELTKKNNNEEYNNLLKFVKTYKRYRKSSEVLLKELKDFKEKINNPLNKTKFNTQFQSKYESCPENIQKSPNCMLYKELFKHYFIILNFFNDFKIFMKELEELKKKDKLIDGKRENSVQIHKNGFDLKTKNRERSRNKEREKEKEKEKEKERDKDKEKEKKRKK